MAESDWDTVTVLRKKGPSAAQAKSKQVSGGSGGDSGGDSGGAGPGLGVLEAAAPSSPPLTAHLWLSPLRRSWRRSGAGRTWRPPRSVGITPVRVGAGGGTARLSQRPAALAGIAPLSSCPASAEILGELLSARNFSSPFWQLVSLEGLNGCRWRCSLKNALFPLRCKLPGSFTVGRRFCWLGVNREMILEEGLVSFVGKSNVRD